MPSTVKRLAITEVDLRVLRALNRFHYLTASQASRLLYPDSRDENRYSQRRLKRLVDAGYVLRLRGLPTPRFGSAPLVFTLARRGRQYLETVGIRTSAYYRPSEEEEKARNNPYMEHTLAAIDVLIAADLLCLDFPVTCPALLCERELRHRPVRVDVLPPPGHPGEKRTVAVVPDGWFQLHVAGDIPRSISLELDRGTEDQKRWRGKVAAICAWAKGPYRQVFQTDTLIVAVVTSSDMRREQLRDWTSRELSVRHLEELGSLFLFASSDPVTTPPASFFFDDRWYMPGEDAPMSLLDRPSGLTPAPQPERPHASSRGQRVEAVLLEP